MGQGMRWGRRLALAAVFAVVIGTVPTVTPCVAQYRPAPAPMPMPSPMPSPLPKIEPDQPLAVPTPMPQPMPHLIPAPIPAPGYENLAELHKRVSELHLTGRYSEAIGIAEEYVDLARLQFGDGELPHAAALTAVSIVYRAQGRNAEAEPIARRALAIHQEKLGLEHINVVGNLDNLAQLLQEMGRLAEAGPLYKRALAITQKTLPSDHPRVAGALNNLAWYYQAQGRYREAEPVAKRALAIVEKSLGPGHEDVGRIRDTLALIYEGQGLVERAEPHYRAALVSLEKTLGPSHPEVAVVRGNLGGLLKSQGQLAEAEKLLESAHSINRLLGRDHPAFARSMTDLADLYRLQGQCEKANDFFLQARGAYRAIKEVFVFYGTDRQQDSSKPTVVFGGERGELSFGLTTVVLPSDQQTGAVQAGKAQSSGIQAKAARRLSMHCIQTMRDDDTILKATQRLAESKSRQNEALVFVHGYNVSFESGLRRAAQIANDIGFDGSVFLFSWPARGTFMDYWSDREVVDLAAAHLQDFLEKIVRRTNVTKVHFVAHSMGNMVLLGALKGNSGSNALGLVIGEIVSASPDVDPDVFVQITGKIKNRSGITLYASSSDRALWFSSWMRDRPRAGFIRGSPLTASGFETIDITAAGMDWFGLNHDVYAASPIVVADMHRIISTSSRPPHKRTQELELTKLKNGGAYWRLRTSIAQ